MNRTPEKVVCLWLQRLHIPVSPALIKRQLKTHPDYPSLLSITDTLDYLGIENAAMQIEKNLLHEVTTPFLAHLKTNGGEFVMADNRDTLEKNFPGFFNNWGGVVVMAEKNPEWKNKENEEFLKKDKQNAFKRNTAIIVVLLMAFAASVFSSGWLITSLIIVALAGVFVSWLIVSKDLGIENAIADQVCGEEAGCDVVIKSGGAKLPLGLTWSDIGISWFGSLLILLIIGSFTESSGGITGLLSYLSATAIPFTFFSVYYQWRVAKKWCRLCLMTVGLLCIQVALLLPSLITGTLPVMEIKDILTLLTILFFVSISWLTFKDNFSKINIWENEALKGLRFKMSEPVFSAMLQKTRVVDVTAWQHDIQLGNCEAPVQIMVACSPYCAPCAKAHEVLHELLETHNQAFGLTIRFTLIADSKEDKRAEAIQYILQHIHEVCANKTQEEKSVYSGMILQEWFKHMNYEIFTAAFPNRNKINVTSILLQHEKWSKSSDIRFTPTVFINGRELPAGYEVADIAGLLNLLPGIFQQKRDVNKTESIMV